MTDTAVCGHPTRRGSCEYPAGFGRDSEAGKCYHHHGTADTCTADGCERSDLKARGLCTKHYQNRLYHDDWRGANRTKVDNSGMCRVGGCERDAHVRRYCSLHYHRVKRNGEPGGLKPLRSSPVRMELAPDNWKPTTIAWFAGLFEGEGHVGASVRDSGYVHLRARISMTDEDVIRGVASKIGGRVRGPYKDHRSNRKPSYVWAAEAERAYAVLVAIYSLLGDRRQAAIREAVSTWSATPRDGQAG